MGCGWLLFYSCLLPVTVNLLPHAIRAGGFAKMCDEKAKTPNTVNFLEFSALSFSSCSPVTTREMCISCDSVPLIIFF